MGATTNQSANAQWNQRFCFPPSPIALLQLFASFDGGKEEEILGKFHMSPLTEGPLIRPLHPSLLGIYIQIEIELNDWDGDGIYDPNAFSLQSVRSGSSSSSRQNIPTLSIEADRYK